MKNILFFFLTLTFLSCSSVDHESIKYPEYPDNALNFIVASDLGRNGYYEQKPIAELMGSFAENVDIAFIAAAGDVHHFDGVASVMDPLWMTNFELVYSHPELMIDWFAICGNHEYRGNTQAILDYSKISRRWNAPSKYYTKVFTAGDSTKLRLVFIDTAPLIDKYREDNEQYPDVISQDMNRQLNWLDSVLLSSTEKWKIVVGHHPVFAQTTKDESERSDMKARLAPILEKYNVDVYYCGHIHNFQHIKPDASKVDYVVNSSASLSRSVETTTDTRFTSDAPGFTICSVTDGALNFCFVDGRGNILYEYKRVK